MYKFNICTVYYWINLASPSPPIIFSTPVNVRLGSPFTIQCKPDRESIFHVINIVLKDPFSSIILRVSRMFNYEPLRLYDHIVGSTLTIEDNLPVISVTFNRSRLQNAGNYTCLLQFENLDVVKAEYNLVVWGGYLCFNYVLCNLCTFLKHLFCYGFVDRGTGYSFRGSHLASQRWGGQCVYCQMLRRCGLPVRQSTIDSKRRPADWLRACCWRLRCYSAYVLPLWQNALQSVEWPEQIK